MENYYEVLKVNKEASKSEIKKAYAKLLRQFPPETHPEEFKVIRAAYETLSNDDRRKAYDVNITYNCDTTSNDRANTANGLNFNSFFRNTHKTKNFTINAEINSESDFREVLKTFNYYYSQKNYRKAAEILNSAIDKDNTNPSNNVIYYLELVNLYASINDLKNLSLTLIELFDKSEIHKKSNAADYIFEGLKKLSLDLYSKRKYYFSKAIARRALQIHNFDAELVNIMRRLKSIDSCKDVANRLEQDHTISVSLRHFIALWFNENIDDDERASKFNDVYEEIRLTNINELAKSIQKIKNNYRAIYDVDPNFFINLNDKIKRPVKKNSLLTNMQIHPRITFIIIFIFFRIFISFSNTGFNSSTSQSTSSNSYVLPVSVKLPALLPSGYVLKSSTFKGSKNIPKGLKLNDIMRNKALLSEYSITSILLCYTNGKSNISFKTFSIKTIDFPQYITSGETLDIQGSTATYSGDAENTQLLINEYINFNPNIDIDSSFELLYKINVTNDATAKSDLISMAQNLR